MNTPDLPATHCGLDTVEVARVEHLLESAAPEDLRRLFAAHELADAGEGAERVRRLAARFAAKEACCKLFPHDTALGRIEPGDFSVRRDGYGAPQVEVTAKAQATLDRHRISRIRVSLTHTRTSASAMAWTERMITEVPWYGRMLYHLLPYRHGVILGNLRRVFGDVLPEHEIRLLAQAYYAHFARFAVEFIRLPFMSKARRRAWIRVENVESPIRAHAEGRGVLLLTGHFGNWEIATVAGIGQFPQYRDLFYFLRRPLRPRLLNEFVNWRFRRAGFGTLPQRGSLEAVLDLLSRGGILVFTFDQHAGRKDGIAVDLFGHPAGTFKSLALLALSTRAPVIPASSWREPDGSHVLRFEDPIPLIECEEVAEAIRRNTRAYNMAFERMLLRHPEQWIWMHRRWKLKPAAPASRPGTPPATEREGP